MIWVKKWFTQRTVLPVNFVGSQFVPTAISIMRTVVVQVPTTKLLSMRD